MKRFIAVLAVLALTLMASVAMAEVTISGSIDIRSLVTNNVSDFTSNTADHRRDTEERVRINVDAKNDNVKGRVTIENDWTQWGTATSGFETAQSNPTRGLDLREAWIDFQIPGAGPAHVKVGHQFLQLGNGWFFRSGKYGSDAWVVGLPGKNTIAFVDVKIGENATGLADDTDAYVLLDNFKITDTQTVGVYLVHVIDQRGYYAYAGIPTAGSEATLNNIGLWYNGKLGPLNLQAEADLQMGDRKTGAGVKNKYKGNQIVLQANLPIDPLSINATLARGTGNAAGSTDIKAMQTALDADPHYTFVYEYLARGACGAAHQGFCNTTAANLGVGFALSKNLSVNLDYWMLKATEKIGVGAAASDDLGSEIDLLIKWKLYDQLTWNWQLGRLMAGKAYNPSATVSADNVDMIQGILSYKF